jgi:hypothetical protein
MLSEGGWDRRLVDPVIIVISSAEPQKVYPDPGWPNPEDYADVHWREFDDDADELWKPTMVLLDIQPAPKTLGLG